jgi:hypothetical protein
MKIGFRVARLLFAVVACLSATGCIVISPAGPHDLALVSVTLVDYRDATEIRKIGGGYDHPPPLLLKVEFSSTTDVMELAHQHGFSVYGDAVLCPPDGTSVRILGFPGVFWSKLQVQPYSFAALPCNECRRGNHPKLYHIYIPVWQIEHPPYDSYDLSEHPKNICFHLGGGDMLGRYFLSN